MLSEAADRSVRLIKEIKQIATAGREQWPNGPAGVGELVGRAVEVAALPAGTHVVNEVDAETGALQVEASDLAPLAISKLLEESFESAPRGAARPLSVEAAVPRNWCCECAGSRSSSPMRTSRWC